eukprot:837137_1
MDNKAGNWSKAEERQFVCHLVKVGAGNWEKFSNALPGRNGRQCESFYRKLLLAGKVKQHSNVTGCGKKRRSTKPKSNKSKNDHKRRKTSRSDYCNDHEPQLPQLPKLKRTRKIHVENRDVGIDLSIENDPIILFQHLCMLDPSTEQTDYLLDRGWDLDALKEDIHIETVKRARSREIVLRADRTRLQQIEEREAALAADCAGSESEQDGEIAEISTVYSTSETAPTIKDHFKLPKVARHFDLRYFICFRGLEPFPQSELDELCSTYLSQRRHHSRRTLRRTTMENRGDYVLPSLAERHEKLWEVVGPLWEVAKVDMSIAGMQMGGVSIDGMQIAGVPVSGVLCDAKRNLLVCLRMLQRYLGLHPFDENEKHAPWLELTNENVSETVKSLFEAIVESSHPAVSQPAINQKQSSSCRPIDLTQPVTKHSGSTVDNNPKFASSKPVMYTNQLIMNPKHPFMDINQSVTGLHQQIFCSRQQAVVPGQKLGISHKSVVTPSQHMMNPSQHIVNKNTQATTPSQSPTISHPTTSQVDMRHNQQPMRLDPAFVQPTKQAVIQRNQIIDLSQKDINFNQQIMNSNQQVKKHPAMNQNHPIRTPPQPVMISSISNSNANQSIKNKSQPFIYLNRHVIRSNTPSMYQNQQITRLSVNQPFTTPNMYVYTSLNHSAMKSSQSLNSHNQEDIINTSQTIRYLRNPTLNSNYQAMNPTRSAMNPTHSAMNLTRSAMNLTRSVLNPISSAMNPTSSAINPTRSSMNLTRSTINTISSAMNPTSSAMNPTSSAMNPTSSAMNPSRSAMNPTRSAMNLTRSVLNPISSAMNPISSAMNPISSAMNPNSSAMNPTRSVMNQTRSSMNPTSSVMNPISSAMNPISSTLNPIQFCY